MKKLLCFLFFLFILTGCFQPGFQADKIRYAELPAAELINIPLAEDTISFSFICWVDDTRALICRNAQNKATLDTYSDFFIYDTASHQYFQLSMPAENRYYFEALAPGNRLLFVTAKNYIEKNGSYAGYRINTAYLYSLSSRTGTLFDLTVAESTSEFTPSPNAEVVFPYDHSPHAYMLTQREITLRYFDYNTDGYSPSPDGTRYAYTGMEGLFVCDAEFENSRLILPDVDGRDPYGMDSEAPRNPRWIDNNRIAYSWIGYEWLVGTGIINSDGSSNNRPAALQGRYITQTPKQDLLIVNSLSDSEPFLGIYHIRQDTMTDITAELNLNYIQNVLISPDCRTLLIIGAGEEDYNTLNIMIELKGDYSGVQKLKRLSGSYEFFNNGVTSVFSPDNKRVLFQASYEGREYMLYSLEISKAYTNK